MVGHESRAPASLSKTRKILFIQPPHSFESGSRPPTTFPLGLCYVATVAKKLKHDVDVLDIWLGQYQKSEVVAKIKNLPRYDVFAIGALSTQYKYVKFLAEKLKKYHNSPIVLGNALATYSPEVVLKNTKVDVCVRGEGEITFQKLIENNFEKLTEVQGISYRDLDDKIIHNQQGKYIGSLDDIPFPDYGIFDINGYLKYLRVWGRPDIVAMNVICSRGCPYNCHFCSKSSKSSRLRSIENIVKEAEILKENYKISGIFFLDELVVISKKRTKHLCDHMKRLNLLWNCQARINTADEELLRYMKKSGCVSVGFGVESGSQKILDTMNKKIKVFQSVKVAKAVIKLNLNPNFQMMYGYPGEDDGTLRETVNFFKEIKYFLKHPLSVTTPLPGSKLYDDCLKNRLITGEDQYLNALDQGYYYRKDVLINLTEFTDKEFMEKKIKIEEEINQNYRNYLRRNPINYLNFYLRRYFDSIIIYYRIYGLFNMIKKVGKKIFQTMVGR